MVFQTNKRKAKPGNEKKVTGGKSKVRTLMGKYPKTTAGLGMAASMAAAAAITYAGGAAGGTGAAPGDVRSGRRMPPRGGNYPGHTTFGDNDLIQFDHFPGEQRPMFVNK